jgi:hypothetical protein
MDHIGRPCIVIGVQVQEIDGPVPVVRLTTRAIAITPSIRIPLMIPLWVPAGVYLTGLNQSKIVRA